MKRLLLRDHLREGESQQDFIDRVEGWRGYALLLLRRYNASHPSKQLFLFWENDVTTDGKVTEISLFIQPAEISVAKEWSTSMRGFAEEFLICIGQSSVRVTE